MFYKLDCSEAVCLDIFNMHGKVKNKTIRQCSAFFECSMPAHCVKEKRKDHVNEPGMEKHL